MRRLAYLSFLPLAILAASSAIGACSGDDSSNNAPDASAADGAPQDGTVDSSSSTEGGSGDASREAAPPAADSGGGDAPSDAGDATALDGSDAGTADGSIDGPLDASDSGTDADADASLHSGSVVEFSIGRQALSLVLGADGNIWFSTNDNLPDAGLDPAGSLIGSITPAGAVTFYPRPTSGSQFQPFQLAAAPDGTIWYANFFGNFGRILSPSAGAACDAGRYGETFAVPGSGGSNGIALDSQGNPWLFAATNSNGFPARFSPPASCTTYADASDGFDVFAPASVIATTLVRGPDGAMWFGESSKVARIAPDGTIAEYPLGETNSGEITVGPDGFIWFEWTGGVGKFDPTTKLATPYVNAATEGDYPIAAGPDGNIWFAGRFQGVDQLGRMKTDGTTLPAYPIPGYTQDIAVGGDGNMWFTDGASFAIGYVVP